MDKKLTYKEIVKALEHEIELAKDIGDDMAYSIEMSVLTNALDLINRQNSKIEYQKAEIDLLHDEGMKAYNEVNRLQAKNERLKNAGDNKTKELLRHNTFIEELQEKLKTTKIKAYKEVFEKLNDKALVRKIKLFGNWFIVKGVTLHDINTLKKELVGKEKK